MIKRVLCRVFYVYLIILEKTVRLKINFLDRFDHGAIIGFWHEDSYIMNLLLKKLADNQEITIIVTADKRGDYISDLIERCHGTVIRLPDGLSSRYHLKDIIYEVKKPLKTMAVAMDGPLGPRKKPKSFVFYLSEKGNKDFITIKVTYSLAVSLFCRWDHYHIPLPFTTINISVKNHGITNKSNTSKGFCQ